MAQNHLAFLYFLGFLLIRKTHLSLKRTEEDDEG